MSKLISKLHCQQKGELFTNTFKRSILKEDISTFTLGYFIPIYFSPILDMHFSKQTIHFIKSPSLKKLGRNLICPSNKYSRIPPISTIAANRPIHILLGKSTRCILLRICLFNGIRDTKTRITWTGGTIKKTLWLSVWPYPLF